MADIAEITGSFQDVVSSVTQELLVTVVFFISLFIWKYVGQHTKKAKQQKDSKLCQPSSPAKKAVSGQSLAAVDRKALQPVEDAEVKILKLLEQREFTRALNFFRGFERIGRDVHFSESLFSSLMQSAIRVGKIDVVERLLRCLKRRDTPPSQDFWRTTLKMLSSRKHYEACGTIAALFGASIPADKVIFSCLINAALENATPERAVTMLGRYREATDLDPGDYVLFFRTYAAVGDVDSSEKVFRELGVSNSALMLNLLLLTCVKAHQPERALALLHEAHALQEGRASDVELVDNESIVDVVSYNTCLKGFAQAGQLSRCFDCLHEMRSHNLEPDDVTFGTLLDMCIADKDTSATNEVVDLLLSGDRADAVICTLVIKGLVRAQRLPKAMQLYEEMRKRNCKGAHPDIVTYSVLIKAFVDSHDLEKALLLVEDMVAAGLSPDDIILTHLLEGCRHVGNLALGKKLFEDMIAGGIKPSEFTLIGMVKLHGRCGAHEEAHQLVANWRKLYGFDPSVIHYTCLMSGCLRTKNYDQAWEAYKLMKEMNVVPDATTIATLLQGMVAAQQWENVLALATHALKSNPPIHVATEALNAAVSQMRLSSDTGTSILVQQLQTVMREAKIQITTRNHRERERLHYQ